MSEGASLCFQLDWVIRLNPDVIILDSRWILKTMLTPDVTQFLSTVETFADLVTVSTRQSRYTDYHQTSVAAAK